MQLDSALQDIVAEAVALADAARQQDTLLRITGSVAVALYATAVAVTRPTPIKDIDLVCRKGERRKIQRLFADRGYLIVEELLLLSEDRETYVSPASYTVDVYYDAIDGSHTIDLSSRLELSYPMVTWTDLLLSKLQRRTPRQIDVWDCWALISTGIEKLEVMYYQRVLGRDWGLYCTVLDNLNMVRVSFPSVAAFIAQLQSIAETAPRSLRWRLRGVLGRRTK